ncbi:phosphomevalonate kinase [Kickxella alabastrina]|nr:phosphomevalonate kinase [Kickxella alabastrina]
MTSTSNSPITVASAPGKVLIVGGYLVLDRNYSGLVVGTDACLYAAVQTQAVDVANGPYTLGDHKITISVLSPQFRSAWWKYSFDSKDNSLSQYASADNGENPFVQVVIRVVMGLVNQLAPGKLQELLSAAHPALLSSSLSSPKRVGLKIVLSADNDFYSQRETLEKMGLSLGAESLKKLPRMCETGTTLRGVHKTGLGSSAAMVTSLVAAILVHFGIIEQADLQPGQAGSGKRGRSQQLIHNVAQYTHCLAQGKVGSGFDVSAAVYGSHVYRRFSPDVLDSAMGENIGIDGIEQATSPENPGWNSDVTPVSIPPRFILRLADVDAGSNTPSMVRKVIQYQKSSPREATALWSTLDVANTNIRTLWDHLTAAAHTDSADYNLAVDWCATHKSSEWKNAPKFAESPSHQLLVELVEGILRVRALQRQLGDNAQVPIEPLEQTKLLDACMEVPGVCMAAVPGAGGYDAIFCITLGEAASSAVAELWLSWTEMSVGPLLANQASSGVRTLDPELYPEIISQL